MNEIASQLKQAIDRLRRTVLFHTRDEYGDIYVYEQQGRRLLTFDEKFEQSAMALAQPYRPEHRYIRAMLLPLAFGCGNRFLHLGLGGGALVRAITHLRPKGDQTAVELRAGVRRVVQHYFLTPDLLPASAPVRIVGDEATRFIRAEADDRYDFISADLYLAEGMDIRQASDSFLHQCQRCLTSSGWLALNFTRLPGYNDPVFVTLRALFREVIVVSVDALNFVVLAGRAPLNKPLMGFAPAVRELGQRSGVNLLQQLKQATDARSFFHETE